MKVAQSRKTGLVGGNQGAGGFRRDYHQLNLSIYSSRDRSPVGIGLSGKARQRIKVKTGERAMKLKTRVFELCNGYQSLPKLAQAMGISQNLIYRVRRGDRNISGRFILGATKAFPGYKLDDLFYVED